MGKKQRTLNVDSNGKVETEEDGRNTATGHMTKCIWESRNRNGLKTPSKNEKNFGIPPQTQDAFVYITNKNISI